MENEDGDGVEVHQESLSSSSSSSLSSSPSHPASSSSTPSTPKQHSIQSSSASSPSSSVLFSGASSPAHRIADEDGVEAEGTLHHDSRLDGGASSSAQQDFSTELNQDYNDSSQVLDETGSQTGNINAEEPYTSGGTELAGAMLDTSPVNDRSQHSTSGLESKTDDITVEKFEPSEGELHTSVQLGEPAISSANQGTQENAIEDHSKETSAIILGLNGSSILPSPERGSNYAGATMDAASMDGSYQHLRSKDNFQLNDVPGNASQAMCDHESGNSQLRPVPLGPHGLSRCKEDFSQEDPAISDQVPLDDSEKVHKGLQRAQTMPNGSFKDDDVTGIAKRRPSFRRSSTDKSKGSEKDNARTPGAKLSKRQQKKLMKRLCTVKRDGTVEFDVDGSTHLAPDIFGTDTGEEFAFEGEEDGEKTIQPLQIAMLIVGTRGDVQPFVAIGKHLQEYGHRVRLATHSNFREFVLKAGLEFFPLGGDPKVLAGYMVKNKGFLPSGPSEIRTQRKQLKSIINSLLPACKDPDKTGVPFRAQAIIANPPAYGHVHVAEYLKVPLHIFFTMPWTPTSEFPHPLSRVHHFAANRLSYQVVDSLIWWGIRGIINDFRKKKLKLRPITYLSGSQLSVSKLPTGYIWSPHLVPKPKDWGPKVDVVGFCFLNLSQDYEPPEKLVRWLAAGRAPIYVGFGSLPVEDPQGMTKIIIEALAQTYQRGIIDKGWGGIGNMENLPASVYLLDNCPHDWLFPQCTAVVHHGGAGTTAAGLKAACPTTIVPFFGDQPFWGDRVHARGVGPSPIPVAEFSLDKLVNAIKFMLEPQVKQNAIELAEAMKEENGVVGAVKAFHKHLPSVMPESIPQMLDKSFYNRIVNHKMWPCFGGGDA